MQISSQHNKVVLALDLLVFLFYCAAVYHLTQKPGLPMDIRYPKNESQVRSIDGTAVDSEDGIEFLLISYRIGDTVRIQTAGTAGLIESTQTLVPYYSSRYVVIAGVVAVLFFLLGFLVYVFRPNDQPAMLFHIVSNGVAAAMVGTKAISALSPQWLGTALCIMFLISYSIIPALVVHFTFLFPRKKWKGLARGIAWLYVSSIVLAGWQSITFLLAAHARSIGWFATYSTASTLFSAFLFCSLTFGILNFCHSYLTAVELSEKKKLRWILYGLSVGAGPYLLLWVLPPLLGSKEWIPEEVFVIFLVLIPVTFGISIVKYHVLDIDFLLNRSTVYAIVLGLLVTVYATVVGFIAWVIGTAMTDSFLIAPIAASVIVALVFQPVRARVQEFVDKRFFRVQYNFREAQRAILGVVQSSFEVQQLGDLLLDRLDALLPVERAGLFALRQPGYRIRLLAHRGFETLVSHGVRFEFDKLKTSLAYPVALDAEVEPGIQVEPADTEVFRRWGMALVFSLVSKTGEILGFLVLGKKRSGLRFTIEDVDLLNAVAVQVGSAIDRIMLQQKLIVERAESQRLEELTRLQSYFVSSVSHDLKTPLTSIKMFAELLQSQKELPAHDRQEYLQIIEGESDRLARLINNVLDFGKTERGIREYHFITIDLNEVVCDALRTMKYQFTMDRCAVEKNLSETMLPVDADRDAVIEALINLFANSLKYSSEKKHIWVSTRMKSSLAAIDVQDNGIGIPEEDINKIFEPFFRARAGQVHGAGGAGLGLAIVKHIMDGHGGTIEVQSTPGKGSVFTLLFPTTKG